MKRILSLLIAAAVCGAGWSASSAKADDASPFRLLPAAQVAADGSTSVDVTPVRTGYGWRGYGYYGGWNRPYYGGGYRGGYYNGYRGGYYGGYRTPYYSGYRGNYYGPGVRFGFY